MARVVIQRNGSKSFFKRVKAQTGLSYFKLAKLFDIHRRSFSDWAGDKCSMPKHVFEKLVRLSGIRPSFKLLPDYWHVKEAGRKGGYRRIQLVGNPGTPEGRWLGGMNSYKKFRANPNFAKQVGFTIEKDIKIPNLSSQLAELFGIFLGDGGISSYQVTVTLHGTYDLKYSRHVRRLINTVFGVQPKVYKKCSTISIMVPRIKLVRFLLKRGLLIGGKVRQQVRVPEWIEASPAFSKACLRGLLDTDGCFYLDKHKYNGKSYLNPALNFTNRSLPVLRFFKRKLEDMGYHPTQKTKYSVFLRREEEIIRYFKEIGTSNPKHKDKFKAYLKNKYGEVPKRS